MDNTSSKHLVCIEGKLYSHARAQMVFRRVCQLYDSMNRKFALLRLIDIAFARYQLGEDFIAQSLVNYRLATHNAGKYTIDDMTLAMVRELDRQYDLHGHLRQYIVHRQDIRHELAFPFAIVAAAPAIAHGDAVAADPAVAEEPVLPSRVQAFLRSL